MTPEKRTKIFQHFQKHNPTPTTELIYSSPFELLVSVMLSAQMTDKGVNKATEKLFPVANTPEKILKLGEAKLLDYLKSINYHRTKTKNLFNTSQILVQKYNSQVPNTREDLESLPGIGRKSANVILSVAFEIPAMAVDTHIFRVSNRTKLAPGKTPREVEEKLVKLIPKKFLPNAHHWLVLHGRYTCTARKPHCSQCIIQDLCEFEDKNL